MRGKAENQHPGGKQVPMANTVSVSGDPASSSGWPSVPKLVKTTRPLSPEGHSLALPQLQVEEKHHWLRELGE